MGLEKIKEGGVQGEALWNRCHLRKDLTELGGG